MKYVTILMASFLLSLPVSVVAQTCDNADAELEAVMSSTSSTSVQIDKLINLLQRCPDFSKGLNNLGVLYEEQGKIKDAAELYRRAIHVDQRFPHPYIGLGDIHFQQKQYNLAAAMYNEVLILYQSPSVKKNYPDLEESIPTIQDRLNKCQAGMPVASRGLQVVNSEVIESQLKEESTELSRGIAYKSAVRPKIALSITFDYNSAEISKASYAQMAEIGKALNSDTLKSAVISIEGHADAMGSDEYNQELSKKRSESVKKFLANNFGIGANRLKTVGYGETRPLESNDTEQGRAANRRVELVNTGSM
ncbi:MAG: OmpA family protein [Desulfatirhabdiaceae bacterium]